MLINYFLKVDENCEEEDVNERFNDDKCYEKRCRTEAFPVPEKVCTPKSERVTKNN